jgi:hypothetical protein
MVLSLSRITSNKSYFRSFILSRRCIPLHHHHSWHQYKIFISTSAAKSILGFSEGQQFTIRELRHAYFEAAKRWHPDVAVVRQQKIMDTNNSNEHTNVDTIDFRDITDAYEHLLNCPDHHTGMENKNIITIDEDEEYRQACQSQLGLPAEIVEESKRNPMFRKWLLGNTDAAHLWRVFLAANGGLAQKLRPIAGYLEKGTEVGGGVKKSETRRRRSRR